MIDILTYLAAFLLYILVGWLIWHNLHEQPALPKRIDEKKASFVVRKIHYAMLVPLMLHALTLYQTILAGTGLNLGVGSAVSLIVWLTAFIYWFSGFFSRYQGLQTLLAPIAAAAAIAVVLPLVFPSLKPLENTELPAFKAHLIVAMSAYSLLTIAALHAVLMTIVEYQLHHPATHSLLSNLPPLLAMEKLLFGIIWVGFILLSLTLLSGVVFSKEVFGQSLTFSHKTLFGFISWGTFAALLIGRQFYGWRGRIAIRWTLVGFVMLLLAYIGSKFVLEVVLNR
ncbi:MAG: cytochrome c biogenesis protein CcsA [Burkholderiales bacterium]|nr:cytochrome c biogenesis protein CcsA [Nitrosomonas sp.]MCP5275309.1 cytochrome c biogenesis protein CcsA [Burkholderiales bacterium]